MSVVKPDQETSMLLDRIGKGRGVLQIDDSTTILGRKPPQFKTYSCVWSAIATRPSESEYDFRSEVYKIIERPDQA